MNLSTIIDDGLSIRTSMWLPGDINGTLNVKNVFLIVNLITVNTVRFTKNIELIENMVTCISVSVAIVALKFFDLPVKKIFKSTETHHRHDERQRHHPHPRQGNGTHGKPHTFRYLDPRFIMYYQSPLLFRGRRNFPRSSR